MSLSAVLNTYPFILQKDRKEVLFLDSTIIGAIISGALAFLAAIIAAIIGRFPPMDDKEAARYARKWKRRLARLTIILLIVCIGALSFACWNLYTQLKQCREGGKETTGTLPPIAETISAGNTSESLSPPETETPFVLPGTTIFLGSFEQDGDTFTGPEAIEWIALRQDGDKILLISTRGLSADKYKKGKKYSDWENSSLREWLNGTFFHTAFSEEERNYISARENEQHANEGNPSCAQGNPTTDHVFLLSAVEYVEHMQGNGNIPETMRYGDPVTAIKNDVELTNEKYSWWWLRTSAKDQYYACSVTAYGSVNHGDHEVNAIGMVRPAIWVKADLFDSKN